MMVIMMKAMMMTLGHDVEDDGDAEVRDDEDDDSAEDSSCDDDDGR